MAIAIWQPCLLVLLRGFFLLLLGEDLCDGLVFVVCVLVLLRDGRLLLDGRQRSQVHGCAHSGDALKSHESLYRSYRLEYATHIKGELTLNTKHIRDSSKSKPTAINI